MSAQRAKQVLNLSGELGVPSSSALLFPLDPETLEEESLTWQGGGDRARSQRWK